MFMRYTVISFIILLFLTHHATAEDNLDELAAILSGASANAMGDATNWKCTIESQLACKKGACGDIATKDWLELDFIQNTYARCGLKGCKNFPMLANESGDYTVVALPENGVTFKLLRKDGSFSEAASIAGLVVNSFGTCATPHNADNSTPVKKPTSHQQKNADKPQLQPKKISVAPLPEVPTPQSMEKGYNPFTTTATGTATDMHKITW